MDLFHSNLDLLSFDDIARFCEQRIREGTRLDYKRELPPSKAEDQVTKIVSAFANTQGGLVIYGVGTPSGQREPDWPAPGMPADPMFADRVFKWCINRISPPVVPTIGYVLHPESPNRAFAVIRVEPSDFTPHALEEERRVYVRHGDNSDPVDATLREIYLLRDRRAAETAEWHRRQIDTRERAGFEGRQWNPESRTMGFLISPRHTLDGEMEPSAILRTTEVLGKYLNIGKLTSYSHGVIGRGGGLRFVLTNQGAVAHMNLEARSPNPSRLALHEVVRLCCQMVFAASTVARELGYWGALSVDFEANNQQDRPVGDMDWKCVDHAIRIHREWDIPAIRSNPAGVMTDMVRKIMWAFGVTQDAFDQENIKLSLAQLGISANSLVE